MRDSATKARTPAPAKEATVNACRLCSLLGAAIAFKGVEGAVCVFHGSQGCSTYIRRYLISHFREPIDIASTNFTEESAVFGGAAAFSSALDNLERQYAPAVIGAASTCLAETIGEDMPALAREREASRPDGTPLVAASTPAYAGSHRDGYRIAVEAILHRLSRPCVPGAARRGAVVIPPIVSCADLRWLKSAIESVAGGGTLVPDWSDPLEGGPWAEYAPIPPGGTNPREIAETGSAAACIELGLPSPEGRGAAAWLESAMGVSAIRLHAPMGIALTDAFLGALAEISGRPAPAEFGAERDRLADAYADAHKYAAGKRVLVFGDEDFCPAAAAFLAETGLIPALVACGGRSGGAVRSALGSLLPPAILERTTVIEDADFEDMEEAARNAGIDAMLGNSKGYKLSRSLGVPLVRSGFPVHDRFGGQRIRHLGYGGSIELFERLLNACIEREQDEGPRGYWYF
jgi:nitrogenase molybdenum-iron protein NifN